MKRRLPILLLAALALLLGAVSYWWRGSATPQAAPIPDIAAALPPEAPHPAAIADPAVEAVVNGGISRQELLQRINKLHRRLTQDDAWHLLVWATGPKPARFSGEAWAELANDTLNILRTQQQPPAEMTPRLVAMFRDPQTLLVMKDYAIQHLGAWLADRDPLASWEQDAASQKLGAGVILEAAANVDATYAGTALYSLLEISPRLPDLVPQEKVDALVIAAVDSPATHRLTRISALQAAAQRHLAAVLPAARRLAFDPVGDASLRLSAIACLGEIGGAEDARQLAGIPRDTANARLTAAIDPAIAKISLR